MVSSKKKTTNRKKIMKMLDSGYLPINGFDWQVSSYCVGCNNKKTVGCRGNAARSLRRGRGQAWTG